MSIKSYANMDSIHHGVTVSALTNSDSMINVKTLNSLKQCLTATRPISHK